MKEFEYDFEYDDEQEEYNADQRCDDSCSLNHSETASNEMEALFARSLQKIHEWYDMSVYYVYFK